MINIRKNVFETNSSSSHSFTLHYSNVECELNTIIPDQDGKIVFIGGNFTGSEYDLNTPMDKANVIATMIVVYNDNALKERFERIVKEHTGASELVYDIRLKAEDGQLPNTYFNPSLNSAYRYDSESDTECELFDLTEQDETLKKFIFSPKASIEVGITYS